jgi:hypothetical protein
MNRVHAINELIVNPNADVNNILARTKEAWEGVKVFFHKLRMTFWILLSENHRISFNTASVKLDQLINKVVQVTEPILHPTTKEEIYVEIAEIKTEITKFDEKYHSIPWLELDLLSCQSLASKRAENISWIEEFDRLSLELFTLEEKQPVKKKGSSKRKEHEPKVPDEINDLRIKIEDLRQKINENYVSIVNNPFNHLNDEELKAQTEEYTDLIDQRKGMGEQLREKEKELSEFD